MIEWEEVLKTLISTSAITLLIGYLTRQAIQWFFNGQQERYKDELARDLERHRHALSREADAHRSELQRQNSDHAVQFAALHAQRAEVIRTAYAHICEIDEQLSILASPFVDSDVQRMEAFKTLRDSTLTLRAFIAPNRIYLSPELSTSIAKYLSGAYSMLLLDKRADLPQASSFFGNLDQRAHARQLAEGAHKQLMDIMADLERDFRTLLGHAAPAT